MTLLDPETSKKDGEFKGPKVSPLLADLQKKWPGKVMRGSEIPVGKPIKTGSLSLDFATGYGGFPEGKVVEICGNEGTGKTTLALLTMKNSLEANPGRVALFIDMEHKMDPDWMQTIVGADLLEDRIVYVQPQTIEEATNVYRSAVGTGKVCCVVLDSIGGAPTIRRNDDAEVGHYGGNAMGVGEFSRSAATLGSVHRCLTIGINQKREDMSGYHALKTPGGKAWVYACVLRIELVRGKDQTLADINDEKIPIGYTIYAKVRKNQVGAPGRTAMYWFYNVYTEEYGFGIDTQDELVRLGTKTQVIDRRGGWYYHDLFPGGKAQGISGVARAIRENPDVGQQIVDQILSRLEDFGSEVAPISDPDAPVEETPVGGDK